MTFQHKHIVKTVDFSEVRCLLICVYLKLIPVKTILFFYHCISQIRTTLTTNLIVSLGLLRVVRRFVCMLCSWCSKIEPSTFLSRYRRQKDAGQMFCCIFRIKLKLKDFQGYTKEKMMPEV